jgi:hypothetical protein
MLRIDRVLEDEVEEPVASVAGLPRTLPLRRRLRSPSMPQQAVPASPFGG